MRWFVLFFYGSYASMHLYLWYKVARAFPQLRVAHLFIALFLLLMVAAPVLFRVFDRLDWTTAQRWLAHVGFTWIAPVFWFFMLGVATDAWNIAVRLLGAWAPAARGMQMSVHGQVIGVGVAVLALSAWSLVEAAYPRVREIHIAVPQWPADAPPVRILQLADLHLSAGRGWGLLRRAGDAARELKPDVVVLTGDLVDTSPDRVPDMIAYLAAIRAPLGKFSVTGNHEYYTGLDVSLRFHEAAGFHVLREDAVQVTPLLRIGGVDDPSGHYVGSPCLDDEAKALPPGPPSAASILLKHQPLIAPDHAGRYVLQLSGHTHGGQIFPFHAVIWWMFRYGAGLHDVGGGAKLYVSRGTGTWGPAMRLLAPPEVALFVLEPSR